MLSCQKSVSDSSSQDNGTADADSLITAGDTITYEIITADPNGWGGIWNEPDGTVGSNPVDSITYGSPITTRADGDIALFALLRPSRHLYLPHRDYTMRILPPIYTRMESLLKALPMML